MEGIVHTFPVSYVLPWISTSDHCGRQDVCLGSFCFLYCGCFYDSVTESATNAPALLLLPFTVMFSPPHS